MMHIAFGPLFSSRLVTYIVRRFRPRCPQRVAELRTSAKSIALVSFGNASRWTLNPFSLVFVIAAIDPMTRTKYSQAFAESGFDGTLVSSHEDVNSAKSTTRQICIVGYLQEHENSNVRKKLQQRSVSFSEGIASTHFRRRELVNVENQESCSRHFQRMSFNDVRLGDLRRR